MGTDKHRYLKRSYLCLFVCVHLWLIFPEGGEATGKHKWTSMLIELKRAFGLTMLFAPSQNILWRFPIICFNEQCVLSQLWACQSLLASIAVALWLSNN